MVNSKDIFGYEYKKRSKVHRNRIVPNDPSNIFDFSFSKSKDNEKVFYGEEDPGIIKIKKRRVVNFDDLFNNNIESGSDAFSSDNVPYNVINEDKAVLTTKGKTNVKYVNFDDFLTFNNKNQHKRENKKLLKQEKDIPTGDKSVKDKENGIKVDDSRVETKNTLESLPKDSCKIDCIIIEPKPKTKDEIKEPQNIKSGRDVCSNVKVRNNKCRIANIHKELNEGSDINELLLRIVDRIPKNKYTDRLKEALNEKSNLIQEENIEFEIKRIEDKIKDIEVSKGRWTSIKEELLNDNKLIEDHKIPVDDKLIDACDPVFENIDVTNAKDSNLVALENTNFEIIDKLDKIIFLKDSIKTYVDNISNKINEIEKKIFNLTEVEDKVDTMILLKAITKYK